LRVALAGLGSAATRAHLPALDRLQGELPVTIVAAADSSRERRRHVESLVPATPIFGDAAAMLASVPSDVLVIATQPAAHAELILLGAASDRHVVCEKPLVLDGAQHERVAAAYRRRPDLGLIAVHQYRYSPLWAPVSRWLSRLHRLGVPVALDVEVERVAVDPHASSNWRTDVAASGGMLADHGVHFLALAHTIGSDIELTRARRALDTPGGERSYAQARFGSGTLRLITITGAPRRTTLLRASVAGLTLTWRDADAQFAIRGHTVRRWTAASLSDRDQVDDLYVPFYRELLASLAHADWRRERTAEALTIGRAVVSMLEQANTPGPQPPAAPGESGGPPQSPPIGAPVNLAGRRQLK
jgi:predicted dehydrogenase